MADIFDWSGTPASNTSVNGVNINTGMSPANLDNALREIMAGCVNSFDADLENFLKGLAGLPTSSLDTATAANFRANTADKLLVTDDVWSAAEPVALTDAATVAVDMSAGFNFTLAIGGNRTLGNPTNTKAQSGRIVITQDGTGSRTLAYGSNWEFAGGTAPVLSTAAGAKDVLYYDVLSATSIYATLVKALA